jgi:hypothetical protein
LSPYQKPGTNWHVKIQIVLLSLLLMIALSASAQTGGVVKGVITDDSGAVIPAASVVLSGNGISRNAKTQTDGSYSFAGLPPGQYTISVALTGFSPFVRTIAVSAGVTAQLPIQLNVTAEKQQITVTAEPGPTISVDPDANATALVIKGSDLQALPDDPDDLADALQALAGPGAGPNGGSIYIDGFSGGQLPLRSRSARFGSIRIPSPPSMTVWDSAGSRSLHGREQTSCGARSA